MNRIIVGVTGYARSGKDTVAEYLTRTHGFTRVGLADPLKRMALASDPYVCVSRALAMRVDEGNSLGYVRLSSLVDTVGWDVAKMEPDVRRFLQRIGTEGVRAEFGPNVWVDALATHVVVNGLERVVVPDVRFKNEAAILRFEHGARIWGVSRAVASASVMSHASESEISGIPLDAELDNNGSLEDLYARIELLCS